MKKFIAAFDNLRFSESTMHYAIYLAKSCHAHLVGVFLEDKVRHSYGVRDLVQYEEGSIDQHIKELNSKDKEVRNEKVEIFNKACKDEGLNFNVHRDKNVALQELLHESIYADLLIINPAETLTRFEEPSPTRFIQAMLSEVQCPVLLVPPHFKPFDKITLLYDGEPSSVFAVRAFSYLFEPMKNIDTEVITVKGQEESLHLPDNRLMKEFIKRHYPKAEYVLLKGLPEDEIIRYLHRKKGTPIVVLGAYRRSRISRLFRMSMADMLLQHVKLPLFIAHNKS